MKTHILLLIVLSSILVPVYPSASAQELKHGFAQSGDIKIHYVTAGEGPLLIMIHGFPDYWYTWRKQIPELAKHFKVVAIDQRGYNQSDQPAGVENYTLAKLSGDIQNVIKHFDQTEAILVGHDWGGYVAWTCAMRFPNSVNRLVILNAPHPGGLQRELANNRQQRENSQYAMDFQKADAASQLTPQGLAEWVTDERAKIEYLKAFENSSFDAMLNYYKANYPKLPDEDLTEPKNTNQAQFPKIKCRVLMIHGLEDKALLPSALNDSWQWMEQELTIITIPGAGHFVQQDAAETVTRRIADWLNE